MSKENKKTVEIYKENAKTYLVNSVAHDEVDPVRAKEKKEELEAFIKRSLALLPREAKVFEIGSADGANAQYLQSLGFDVTASDTAEAFLEAERNKGLKAIQFDALEDDFKEKYFAIFCWRVFVHFTKEDALRLIEKVYDALEESGVFIFNAINRETKEVDNEWVDFEGEYHMGTERYYSYFRKNDLDNIIGKTPFHVEDFHQEGGKNKNKWLVYVLKK